MLQCNPRLLTNCNANDSMQSKHNICTIRRAIHRMPALPGAPMRVVHAITAAIRSPLPSELVKPMISTKKGE
jgi:hypothetical protein